MKSIDINKEKLDLISWINGITDRNLIEFLSTLSTSKTSKDWWDELSSYQKGRIETGLKDIEEGRVVSSKEAWKKIRNG